MIYLKEVDILLNKKPKQITTKKQQHKTKSKNEQTQDKSERSVVGIGGIGLGF